MSLLDLEIAGTTFAPSSVRGRATMSAPFRFEVRAYTLGGAPAAPALVGQTFKLTLRDRFEQALEIHGLVVAAERVFATLGDAGSYALSLGPATEALAIGADCRVFQDMTAVDIVKDVLTRGGLADQARWAVSSTYASRPYCAQYRESDWAFVERLLAEEGIAYWYEHKDGETKLVLGDATPDAVDLPGGPTIPFHDDALLGASGDSVQRVRRTRRAGTEAVTVRDYDFTKPRLALEGKATRASGRREVYDFPARVTTPDAAKARAQAMLDALSADRDVVTGVVGGVRLTPGLAMEIEGHPVETLNARYLVRDVAWDLEQAAEARAGRDERRAWAITWAAIPIATPFRAVRGAITRAPGGPQTGVVVGPAGKEIHPDDTGRVRVQFRWDRLGKKDETSSTWQRVGQIPLGGSMFLPRVGWDVLAYHYEADIDHPYVFSHLYDGEHPAPYALPANKTRTSFQTSTTPGGGSTNEVRMEDKKGAEELFLNAAKDMNVVVANNLDEKVGVNETVTIGGSSKVTVGSNDKATIGGSQTVSVGASETLSVGAARSSTITGSETASVGGSRTQMALKGTKLDAKAGRTLTVGGSMIGASVMDIGRSSLGTTSVTVGGAYVAAAASGTATTTLGAAAETIGGAKIEAAAASHDLAGKGAVAITAGGALVVAAGGNVGESTTSSLKFLVGGAFVGNGPEISIEGETEISIRVGGATLTITPSSVELKAPAMGAPGAVTDKSGSTIDHN